MKMRPMPPAPPIPAVSPAPLSYRSQAGDRALAAQAAALRKREQGQEQGKKRRDAGQRWRCLLAGRHLGSQCRLGLELRVCADRWPHGPAGRLSQPLAAHP